MDVTHFHLIVTHFPILGIPFGVALGLFGLWWSRTEFVRAGMLTLALACAAGVAAYLSGEGAEETAEHITGVSHAAIEAHEDAAKPAMWGMVALGLLSIGGLVVSRRGEARRLAYVVMAGAVVLTAWNAYVGNLGGAIRHTEIAGDTAGFQAGVLPDGDLDDN